MRLTVWVKLSACELLYSSIFLDLHTTDAFDPDISAQIDAVWHKNAASEGFINMVLLW